MATVPQAPIPRNPPRSEVGAAHVWWQQPANDGGEPISSYQIRSSTPIFEASFGPTVRDAELTGLTNGSRYVFSLQAVNSVGESVSSFFSTVMPGVRPTPPEHFRFSSIAGAKTPTVLWDAAASSGDGAITYYVTEARPKYGPTSEKTRYSEYTTTRQRNIYSLSNTSTIYELKGYTVGETGWSKATSTILPTFVSGFQPTDASGLLLWMDAADPSTLISLNSMKQTELDGEPIVTWLDKSGQGNHMSTVSAEIYYPGVLNSRFHFQQPDPAFITQSLGYNGSNLWIVGGFVNGNRSYTSSLFASTDLETWTPIPNTLNWISFVTYINNTWFATGQDDTTTSSLQQSTDGSTWTTIPNNVGQYGQCIGYNGSLWVFGSATATSSLQTSTDLVTWTTCESPLQQCYSLAYGNGIWVAGGHGPAQDSLSSLVQSTDGITWVEVAHHIPDYVFTVRYENGLWVATGTDPLTYTSTLETSTDGITWNPIDTNPLVTMNGSIYSAVYKSGIWYTPGTDSSQYVNLAYSADGMSTWTAVSSATQGIAYSNIYILENNSSFVTSFGMTKPEGVWNIGSGTIGDVNTVPTFESNTSHIYYPSVNFKGRNYYQTISTLNPVNPMDLTLFMMMNATTPGTYEVFGNTTLDMRLNTATGLSCVLNGDTLSTGVTSNVFNPFLVEGTTSTVVNRGFVDSVYGIDTSGGTAFMAVGRGKPVNTLLSSDGNVWEAAPTTLSSFSGDWRALLYKDGTWLLGGRTDDSTNSSTFLTSSDGGSSWSSKDSYIQNIHKLKYLNGKYHMVGERYSTSYLVPSTNYATGTVSTSNLFLSSVTGNFGIAINSVKYGGGNFLAVGQGQSDTIYFSEAGESWNPVPSLNKPMAGAAYGQSKWVAVGGSFNGQYESTSVQVATQTSISSISEFTARSTGMLMNFLQKADYNGSNLWITVGQGLNTHGLSTTYIGSTSAVSIQYSTDGESWIYKPDSYIDIGSAVKHFNGKWVVGGQNVYESQNWLSNTQKMLYADRHYTISTVSTATHLVNGYEYDLQVGKQFSTSTYSSIYIVAGFGRGVFASSDEGVTWTINLAYFLSRTYDITYSPDLDLFLLGGDGYKSLYQTGGQGGPFSAWNSIGEISTTIYTVECLSSILLYGTNNTTSTSIVYSTDATTWTDVPNLQTAVKRIYYYNSKWVTVSYYPSVDGEYQTSSDLVTWSSFNISTNSQVYSLNCIGYNGSNLYVGGNSGLSGPGANRAYSILTSTDLITWTPQKNSLLEVTDIEYRNGNWYAVGTDASFSDQGNLDGISFMQTSTDGSNWWPLNDASMRNVIGRRISFGPTNQFIVTTQSSIQQGQIWSSHPVVDFKPVSSMMPYDGVADIGHNGTDRWVAVGGWNSAVDQDYLQSSIQISSDGIHWESRPSELLYGTSIAYGNGRWVATGNTRSEISGQTANRKIIYSQDNGDSWIHVPTEEYTIDITSNYASAVAYGNSRWVVGMQNETTPQNLLLTGNFVAKRSIAWTPHIVADAAGVIDTYDIDTNGGSLYIATGSNASGNPSTCVFRSTDGGSKWSCVSSVVFANATGNAVRYGNGQWLVGGTNTTAATSTLYASTDGNTWAARSIPLNIVNTIEYANDLWYIGGTNSNGTLNMMVSSDGVSWSSNHQAGVSTIQTIKHLADGYVYVTGAAPAAANRVMLRAPDDESYNLNEVNNPIISTIRQHLYFNKINDEYQTAPTPASDVDITPLGTLWDTVNPYLLGYATSASGPFLGNMNELLLYNTSMNGTTNLSNIRDYLKRKWFFPRISSITTTVSSTRIYQSATGAPSIVDDAQIVYTANVKNNLQPSTFVTWFNSDESIQATGESTFTVIPQRGDVFYSSSLTLHATLESTTTTFNPTTYFANTSGYEAPILSTNNAYLYYRPNSNIASFVSSYTGQSNVLSYTFNVSSFRSSDAAYSRVLNVSMNPGSPSSSGLPSSANTWYVNVELYPNQLGGYLAINTSTNTLSNNGGFSHTYSTLSSLYIVNYTGISGNTTIQKCPLAINFYDSDTQPQAASTLQVYMDGIQNANPLEGLWYSGAVFGTFIETDLRRTWNLRLSTTGGSIVQSTLGFVKDRAFLNFSQSGQYTLSYHVSSSTYAYSTTKTMHLPRASNPAGIITPIANNLTFIYASKYANNIAITGGGLQPDQSVASSIQTSTDGITWTPRVNNALSINSIDYGNGLWIAVSANSANTQNSIQTSTDGITWISRNHNQLQVYSVAYGNSMWMTCGTTDSLSSISSIQTSTDGITWTPRPNHIERANTVAYGNGLWIVTAQQGYGLSANETLQTSTDGITWTLRPTNMRFINTVKYLNGVWLCGGTGYTGNQIDTASSLQTSTDGTVWTLSPNHLGNINSMTYTNGYWVTGGWNASPSYDRTSSIQMSSDLVNWTPISNAYGYVTQVENIQEKLYIAGDSNGGLNSFPYSLERIGFYT
jgi:hypothetical protein